jgi:O-antigen ligase
VTAFAVSITAAAISLASGRLGLKRLIVIAGILTLTTVGLIEINQQGISSVLSPIDRLSQTLGLLGTAGASGPGRLNLDIIAWNQITRNPLYGAGLDGDSVAQALGGVGVHNMFLLVWVGAGIFGFLGLVIMVASLAGNYLEEVRRSIGRPEQTMVVALAASFLGFVIVSMAEPVVYIRFGWVPAALLIPLRAIRLRAESAATASTNGRTSPPMTPSSRPEARLFR